MRLRLETSDRDPFWIVGDPSLSPRDEMSLALQEGIQITRNQQAVSGAEWGTQVHHDRKNQRVVFTASVRREFASAWERMDFLSVLAPVEEANQLHRWEGDVWLRLDKAGSAEFKEWKLADVVIGISGTQLDGEVGLRISYTVSCGGFTDEANEGESVYASLLGSGPLIWSMQFSISEIDAALAPYGSSVVDYFSVLLYVPTSIGSWSYLENWMPAGDTNPYPGIPGFINHELPFSAFADTWVSDANAFWLANDFALTASRSGDVITITSLAGTPITAMEIDILKTFPDPYGPDSVRMYQRFGTQVSGTTYMLVGTHESTDYQLTGLDEFLT